MNIAICYDNGNVAEHFGQTKQFKIYTMVAGELISSKVIDNPNPDHLAIITLLYQEGVCTVICDSICNNCKDMLGYYDTEVLSGAKGNTDEVFERFRRGELANQENGEACGCCDGCCDDCHDDCHGEHCSCH